MSSSPSNELAQPTSSSDHDVQSERGGTQPIFEELTSEKAVEFSARMIAAARAVESRREDRLFKDAFAERLAGREAMEQCEEKKNYREYGARGSDGIVPSSNGEPEYAVLSLGFQESQQSRGLSIRTRFGDDFFEDCTMSRGIRQVVLLGAGMDTRALRLKAPEGTKVFELDYALVLQVKRDLLQESGLDAGVDGGCTGVAEVVSVEADFQVNGWRDKLLEAGFDPTLPSAWILEGLVMYLEEHEVERMMSVVNDLCPPSSGIFATFVNRKVIASTGLPSRDMATRMKFGTDDPKGFMEAQFAKSWSFESINSGTPGRYPHGADYGIGFADGASPTKDWKTDPWVIAMASPLIVGFFERE